MMEVKALDLSTYYNDKTANISELYSKNTAVGMDNEADGELFSSILNSAMNNITTTNDYLTESEEAKMSFAMGENDNTHDLIISMQKASTALQYTVAVRDKLLEAYKTIMQMQI